MKQKTLLRCNDEFVDTIILLLILGIGAKAPMEPNMDRIKRLQRKCLDGIVFFGDVLKVCV